MNETLKIIGDVHGKTGLYKRLVRSMPPGQKSFQVGDMGVGFKGVKVYPMSQDHRWFRGNHDNPEKCRKNPNYLGDYGYLPEYSLFWLAGAFSIDRIWRTEGVSWWQDEELSYEELSKAIDLYEKVKPRYVISHETAAKAGKIMLLELEGAYYSEKLECTGSRTAEALQMMFDIWKPEEWVFGHYHLSTTFNFQGTKFTCVPELGVYDLEVERDVNHT